MRKWLYFLVSLLFLSILFFPFKKYLFQAILSFLFVFFAMPYYIKWAFDRKIVNKDYHKADKRLFADMSGFVIIFAFLLGIFVTYPFLKGFDLLSITASVFTIVLVAFTGAFDDIFKLNELQKIVLLLVASIPLAVVFSGNTTITLPFFENIDIGLFYPFLFIPLLILVFSNATNMLAGYNGLEAGLAIISLSSFAVYFILNENYQAILLLAPFLGALLAFFYYNKYPAKAILGDIGTLPIGALYAVLAIISSAEYFSFALLSLYLFNFMLYFIFFFFVRGKGAHISEADEKGFLKPTYYIKNGKKHIPWQKSYFLMEYLYKGKLTEKKLVRNFFIIQTIISIIVIILF